MISTETSEAPVGHPNLRPFKKGDPRINKAGGLDKRTRLLRKKLAKMDDKAMALLERLLDEGDIEGLKFWGKYRLPVPSEPKQVDVNLDTKQPQLRPEIAARLAAMNLDG